MSFHKISETFGFVPVVQSAEQLLHDHKLETTSRFVIYYNYGLGKGMNFIYHFNSLYRFVIFLAILYTYMDVIFSYLNF